MIGRALEHRGQHFFRLGVAAGAQEDLRDGHTGDEVVGIETIGGLQMGERLFDLALVACGVVEEKTSEDALGVVEVRLQCDHFAQLGFRGLIARGIEHDHGALEAERGVVGILLGQFVEAQQCFVEAAVVGGELGEDEFVGIVGVLLGSRRDAPAAEREQQNGEFLHCGHRITGTPEHSGGRGHSGDVFASVTMTLVSCHVVLKAES